MFKKAICQEFKYGNTLNLSREEEEDDRNYTLLNKTHCLVWMKRCTSLTHYALFFLMFQFIVMACVWQEDWFPFFLFYFYNA